MRRDKISKLREVSLAPGPGQRRKVKLIMFLFLFLAQVAFFVVIETVVITFMPLSRKFP